MTYIPIFLYHHIHPNFHKPSDFEKELIYLKENGYKTLRLLELMDFIEGKKDFKKAVMITFDDGYADNYVYAYPILKKYNFNAVVFLTTSYISSKDPRNTFDKGEYLNTITRESERNEDGFLRWEEIKKMVDDGVFEVGSHTHTHKRFKKRERYENIDLELLISKEVIKKNLNIDIFSLAWPWGQFDEISVNVAKKLGYKMLFTTITGSVKRGDDPFSIKRINILPQRNPSWFKNRLFLHTTPLIADIYSKIYGLDRKILRFFRG